MSKSDFIKPVHLISAGHIARSILDEASSLTVIAVFGKSFYAESVGGNLVCFVRDDLDNGPINVVCSNWPDGFVRLGMTFIKTGIQHFTSETMTLDASNSKTYFPAEPPIFDFQTARRGLDNALGFLAGMACPDSLAMLLVRQPRDLGEEKSPQRSFFVNAAKHLEAIRSWLVFRSCSMGNPIGEILGLGPGLTPSGDDVIVGILVSLHAIGKKDLVNAIAPCLPRLAREKTNRISQVHLAIAAEGFAAAPLHDCLNDLLAGGDHLSGLFPALCRIGHTSGWDAFAGAFLAIGSVFDYTSPISPLFDERTF